jgi:hypothetical protein
MSGEYTNALRQIHAALAQYRVNLDSLREREKIPTLEDARTLCGASEERGRIVKWLREHAKHCNEPESMILHHKASQIENGDHLK